MISPDIAKDFNNVLTYFYPLNFAFLDNVF